MDDISVNNISNNDNTTNQFITFLINALNEQTAMNEEMEIPLNNYFSRRNRMVPLFNRRNRFEELLQSTLYEKNNTKKILSDKGNDQLKTVLFKKNKFDMNECVITQEEFKEDEEIIQLPCNHIFKPHAIKTWLKEESSKCPICRFELDFIEKTEKPTENTVINNDLSNNRTQMLNNMRMLYNPSSIFLPQNRLIPRRRENIINNMIDMENQYVYDRNLQNAILSSLHETQQTVFDDTPQTVFDDTPHIVENDIQDADDFFSMIENDMVLEDIEDDDSFDNVD